MSLNKCMNILDWSFYFILWAVAVFFIAESDVIQNFLEEISDTYETEIESKEFSLPDFIICDWSFEILELKNLFVVKYVLKDHQESQMVDNFTIQELGMGNCFRVAPPIGFRIGSNLEHQITVRFNSSVNDPPGVYSPAQYLQVL